jgi:hypothetical protein
MSSKKKKRAAAMIERAMAANDWPKARRLIREELRKNGICTSDECLVCDAGAGVTCPLLSFT